MWESLISADEQDSDALKASGVDAMSRRNVWLLTEIWKSVGSFATSSS